MLASLPGPPGAPAQRPAAMHSTRPPSPATDSVLSLPAQEGRPRKRPVTSLSVQVQTLTKRAKHIFKNIFSIPKLLQKNINLFLFLRWK